jgi:hypothetical protein
MTPLPFDSTTADPTLMVVPWHDPVVDSVGYDVRSAYVETFWLSVLGPTATWLLRRLVSGFDRYPLGYEVDLAETAGSLGLAFAPDTACPFNRALGRCIMFGAAQPTQGALAVRRRMPPVAARHLARMPLGLRDSHSEWAIRRARLTSDDRRAMLLAEVMVEAGDLPDEVERQLLSLGVPPSSAVRIAAESARLPLDAA